MKKMKREKNRWGKKREREEKKSETEKKFITIINGKFFRHTYGRKLLELQPGHW